MEDSSGGYSSCPEALRQYEPYTPDGVACGAGRHYVVAVHGEAYAGGSWHAKLPPPSSAPASNPPSEDAPGGDVAPDRWQPPRLAGEARTPTHLTAGGGRRHWDSALRPLPPERGHEWLLAPSSGHRRAMRCTPRRVHGPPLRFPADEGLER